MQNKMIKNLVMVLLAALILAACGPAATPAPSPVDSLTTEKQESKPTLKVLAVQTFLADIAQNVAGERVKVASLIPIGLDPHAFEPTPQDVRKIAESNVLILNGSGFEEWIEKTLENAGGERLVIEASAGLAMREPGDNEPSREDAHEGEGEEHVHEGDPHFWFDPTLVVKYVENIRDGLVAADPEGKDTYAANAAAYIAELNELDAWIKAQVEPIPAERRLMVTDHHTFGYFADRYGFTIIGAIVPSFSTGASPSAQELAGLINQVKDTGAPAIFLESSSSPQLARQVASETGAKVVTDLYTHSITEPGGKAPTYIDMMRHNVTRIVEALK